MAELAAKILLFSDPHYSVDSKEYEEKWFPPICHFLSKIEGRFFLPMILSRKFLGFWDKTTQDAFVRMLKIASRHGPYDHIFGGGDYTPGANESGMLTSATVEQYNSFKRKLARKVPGNKTLVWGDHDTGYRFDVSSKTGVKIGTESGGISADSVKAAIDLIGPPYGTVRIGPALFIYISTNLIRNVNEDSAKELRQLRSLQTEFLSKILQNSKNKLNFIILHDPTVIIPESIVSQIISFWGDKITAIFHGHLHAEYSARLTKLLFGPYRKLCRKHKVITIPAPWGMMGIGGGFLTLEIFSNGSYQIKKHKV